MVPIIPRVSPTQSSDCEICAYLPPDRSDVLNEHARIRVQLREAARWIIAQRTEIRRLRDENARLLAINERLMTDGPPILFSMEEGPERAGVVGVTLGAMEGVEP